MNTELLDLLAARRGHFVLESGHHGDLWLDLDLLFLHPARLAPFVAQLAAQLAEHQIEAICGPLTSGAFLAQMVAARLAVEFYYAERFTQTGRTGLFAVDYRIPAAFRSRVSNKAVAILDDVINAGSATRATFADLQACEARVTAIGALVALNSAAAEFAAAQNIALASVARLPSGLWLPAECPLCAAGVPLETVRTE